MLVCEAQAGLLAALQCREVPCIPPEVVIARLSTCQVSFAIPLHG